MTSYTQEEDAILVQYWPTHSCSEIGRILAERVGTRRSRCSIISRVHRKLMLPPKVQRRQDPPGKRPGPAPKPTDMMTAAKAAAVAVITLPWYPGAQDSDCKRYVRVGVLA